MAVLLEVGKAVLEVGTTFLEVGTAVLQEGGKTTGFVCLAQGSSEAHQQQVQRGGWRDGGLGIITIISRDHQKEGC